MTRDDSNVEFVDGLLGVLGLKSVTTRDVSAAPVASDDVERTNVYGRAYYSTRNRDIVIEALGDGPRPTTMGNLYECLTKLAEGADREEFSEVLTAVRRESERAPEANLEELVRSFQRP